VCLVCRCMFFWFVGAHLFGLLVHMCLVCRCTCVWFVGAHVFGL